ncbi:hypothetical protein [Saccharothrix sp. HUAS TT1]|uniref:hypothetical protein n=1 Tax=unclassified Saccharothrix TaxID=2593673 RepID=UPI00345BEF09
MSEADLRDGLRAAVGDEPPLDFDADALIRRAQDARRRRRALVAVAVATLALTGTVLSLPGVLDRRDAVDAAAGPVLTTTASPAASAPRPPVVVTPAPTRAEDGSTALLSEYLRLRFGQVVPHAKVLTTGFDQARDGAPGFFTGTVRFIDGEGVADVAVRLVAPAVGMTVEAFCADVVCGEPQPRPDGSRLTTSATTDLGAKLRSRTAVHFRQDGSVVQFTAYDRDPGGDGRLRTEVALTIDQLVELATDPKLIAP